MNLLDFSSYFPDEDTCIEHFKTQREKLGIVAKNVIAHRIIGKKTRLLFNANNAHTEPRFGVVQF